MVSSHTSKHREEWLYNIVPVMKRQNFGMFFSLKEELLLPSFLSLPLFKKIGVLPACGSKDMKELTLDRHSFKGFLLVILDFD